MDISEMTLPHPDAHLVSVLTGGTLVDPKQQSTLGIALDPTDPTLSHE